MVNVMVNFEVQENEQKNDQHLVQSVQKNVCAHRNICFKSRKFSLPPKCLAKAKKPQNTRSPSLTTFAPPGPLALPFLQDWLLEKERSGWQKQRLYCVLFWSLRILSLSFHKAKCTDWIGNKVGTMYQLVRDKMVEERRGSHVHALCLVSISGRSAQRHHSPPTPTLPVCNQFRVNSK